MNNNKYDYYYDEENNQIVYYNNENNNNNLQPNNKEPRKKGFFRRFIIPTVLVGAIGISGIFFGMNYAQKDINEKINIAVKNSIDNANFTIADGKSIVSSTSNSNSSDTIKVIEAISNAVVSINTQSESTSSYFGFGSGVEAGAGSGVIIHEDDEKIYIVTNNHVIENAKQVTISLDDDTQVPARFVGTQAEDDIAVISVTKQDMIAAGIDNYEIAKFADSDNIKVGQDVVAIGNAAGEGKSATKGIISAIDKQIVIEGTKLNVIQTDAAINPGNSGGALVSMNGEVVGLNTAKYSSSVFSGQGAIEGMGYSIPSNKVKELVDNMTSGNPTSTTAEKPYLGIQGGNVTNEMMTKYSIPAGAFVSSVSEYSNIGKAGLRAGDVITKVENTEVLGIEEVSSELENYKVGDSVTIRIFREGVELDIKTVLQDYNSLNRF